MISIIVPVYQVENYLKQCIDSILCQTYQDIEILLIDDGSPDRCGEICEKYAAADHRIRVFHTENKGLSAARNFGIDQAQGQYLGFVDSDDWIEPEMYERLLNAAEGAGADVTVCGRVMEHADYKEIISPPVGIMNQEEAVKALALLKIRNPAWDKLWRKECFESIRFPEGRVYEDIATTYRVFLQSERISCIPDALYHYRDREGSISNDRHMKRLLDYFHATKEEYEGITQRLPYGENEEVRNALIYRCSRVLILLWRGYCGSSNEERKRYRRELQDAVGFVRKQCEISGFKIGPLQRRVLFYLCQYPAWWSVAITTMLEHVRRFLRKEQDTGKQK